MPRMTILEKFRSRASSDPQRLVFPEGEDPRFVEAACRIAQAGIAYPVLLGSPHEVEALAKENDLTPSDVEIIDPGSTA